MLQFAPKEKFQLGFVKKVPLYEEKWRTFPQKSNECQELSLQIKKPSGTNLAAKPIASNWDKVPKELSYEPWSEGQWRPVARPWSSARAQFFPFSFGASLCDRRQKNVGTLRRASPTPTSSIVSTRIGRNVANRRDGVGHPSKQGYPRFPGSGGARVERGEQNQQQAKTGVALLDAVFAAAWLLFDWIKNLLTVAIHLNSKIEEKNKRWPCCKHALTLFLLQALIIYANRSTANYYVIINY